MLGRRKGMPDNYVIYLRKSRADLEAEARGEGETLARHEKELLTLSKRLNLNITEIYKEIVSGETIAARPQMQRLLNEVEQGAWSGVVVIEIERLARGDTIDQGIVSQAFKFSNTKIITPVKVYDPANEFDEEYFEFGLFMSRREFKTINRRIQRGRVASVKEGKFISSIAPYGYNKIKLPHEKGFTLEINEEQAKVIRLIYEWYTKGDLTTNGDYQRLGCSLIAKKLDSMHLKPMHDGNWSRASIRDILKNPVYLGLIRWQYRKQIKQIKDNAIVTTRQNSDEYVLVAGQHSPIIEETTFREAQNILSSRKTPSLPVSKLLKNPLSGLIYCSKCGSLMTRLAAQKKTPYDTLKCPNSYCNNISSPMYLVENTVIQELAGWINDFKFTWSDKQSGFDNSIQNKQSIMDNAVSQINKLGEQLQKTYEFLEQGIYSVEIFTERRMRITERIRDLEKTASSLQSEIHSLKEHYCQNNRLLPKVDHLLSVYNDLENAADKNELLKEVVERIEYTKDSPNKKGYRDIGNFSINIYPKPSKF
jgi:DNA invertase Pin-like site-specific DNA recombinase